MTASEDAGKEGRPTGMIGSAVVYHPSVVPPRTTAVPRRITCVVYTRVCSSRSSREAAMVAATAAAAVAAVEGWFAARPSSRSSWPSPQSQRLLFHRILHCIGSQLLLVDMGPGFATSMQLLCRYCSPRNGSTYGGATHAPNARVQAPVPLRTLGWTHAYPSEFENASSDAAAWPLSLTATGFLVSPILVSLRKAGSIHHTYTYTFTYEKGACRFEK